MQGLGDQKLKPKRYDKSSSNNHQEKDNKLGVIFKSTRISYQSTDHTTLPTFGIGQDNLLNCLDLLQLIRIKTTDTFHERLALLLMLNVFKWGQEIIRVSISTGSGAYLATHNHLLLLPTPINYQIQLIPINQEYSPSAVGRTTFSCVSTSLSFSGLNPSSWLFRVTSTRGRSFNAGLDIVILQRFKRRDKGICYFSIH